MIINNKRWRSTQRGKSSDTYTQKTYTHTHMKQERERQKNMLNRRVIRKRNKLTEIHLKQQNLTKITAYKHTRIHEEAIYISIFLEHRNKRESKL